MESNKLTKGLLFYGRPDSYKISVNHKFRYDDGVDCKPTHLEFYPPNEPYPYFCINLNNTYEPVLGGSDWEGIRGYYGYGSDYNVGNDYKLGEWTSWREGINLNKLAIKKGEKNTEPKVRSS